MESPVEQVGDLEIFLGIIGLINKGQDYIYKTSSDNFHDNEMNNYLEQQLHDQPAGVSVRDQLKYNRCNMQKRPDKVFIQNGGKTIIVVHPTIEMIIGSCPPS
ncbi:UNKNOWN [Stylonychia lemnae]|uniref:Uncharacterized protein n=1 Tax=Stylonychia lemnae TaxID=5949 RepID=A0A078AT68_STYLE|nr:UNKNOWN [Stylonychia lemnae]|eukprot:CDW85221.1 UNKNOWN [Stylonychia lemnae]